jgi:hypothetical protein
MEFGSRARHPISVRHLDRFSSDAHMAAECKYIVCLVSVVR